MRYVLVLPVLQVGGNGVDRVEVEGAPVVLVSWVLCVHGSKIVRVSGDRMVKKWGKGGGGQEQDLEKK